MALRLVYFGLPLGALLLAGDGHEPLLTVLSPAAAPGRRRLRRTARGIVLEADELAGARELELLQRLRHDPPDLVVSWFWTRRLPGDWLHLPKRAAFGVHPSLLPRHRGPDPYFWAIDSGDSETGVSAHLLEERYDVGAVLGVERLSVGTRNAWQLARALDRPSLRVLRAIVARYAVGDAPRPVPQDEAMATLAPEPEGDLLTVDFAWSTSRVLRRIRALSPVPGLGLEIDGIRFHVTAARPGATHVSSLEPGEAELSQDQGLALKTVDGAFVVEQAMLSDEDGGGSIAGIDLVALIRERTGRSLLRGNVFCRPSETREASETGIDSESGGK